MNDLQMKLFMEAQYIYYAWLLFTKSLKDTQLMTWSQTVAYKETSVTLPLSTRSGQFWRLLLSASPSIQGISILLRSVCLMGKTPFLAILIPIRIMPKPEK